MLGEGSPISLPLMGIVNVNSQRLRSASSCSSLPLMGIVNFGKADADSQLILYFLSLPLMGIVNALRNEDRVLRPVKRLITPHGDRKPLVFK